jgi:hypothetical protein
MPYFGNSWDEYENSKPKAMKQYFMYGILISYHTYLEIDTKHTQTIDDILRGDDGIQGIFTGRDGDFIIIGKILGTVDEYTETYVVPEIDVNEQGEIEGSVFAQFGLEGDFHYYFIKK